MFFSPCLFFRGTIAQAINHFGASVSELMSNHPSLVDVIVKETSRVLKKVVEMFENVDESDFDVAGLFYFLF